MNGFFNCNKVGWRIFKANGFGKKKRKRKKATMTSLKLKTLKINQQSRDIGPLNSKDALP